jgi:hypothetical protein
MELQFPQSLSTRIQANKKLITKDQTGMKQKKEPFVGPGNLAQCRDACGKCNMCRFRKDAQKVLDDFAAKCAKRQVFDED